MRVEVSVIRCSGIGCNRVVVGEHRFFTVGGVFRFIARVVGCLGKGRLTPYVVAGHLKWLDIEWRLSGDIGLLVRVYAGEKRLCEVGRVLKCAGLVECEYVF